MPFNFFKPKAKKKENKYPHLKRNQNPDDLWNIVGELGDGAYGKVYKTEHLERRSLAALKKVEIRDDEDLEEYMVEIDILTECKHENIVGIEEAFLYDSHLWLYIEFCEAGALDSIMVNLDKPLTEQQIKYVTHEVCKGLQFIHRSRVIHRDLKAGNILLTLDGKIKLADFGVSARNVKSIGRNSFIGTPYWMAPEVIACETQQDSMYTSLSDIWSLGATLIELAEMNPPNHEMHPMRVLIKIQKAEPPTLQDPKIWSKLFHEFLSICFQKTPSKRKSATELLNHDFIKDCSDSRPIRLLIAENRADVIEEEEKLDPEIELQKVRDNVSDTTTDTESLVADDETSAAIDEALNSLSDNQSSKSSTLSISENESSHLTISHTVPNQPSSTQPCQSVSDRSESPIEPSSDPDNTETLKRPQIVIDSAVAATNGSTDGEWNVNETVKNQETITNIDDLPDETKSEETDLIPNQSTTDPNITSVINVDDPNFSPESVITDIDAVLALHDDGSLNVSKGDDTRKSSTHVDQMDELSSYETNLIETHDIPEHTANEVMGDIIDEVLQSDSQEPSVPEVVLQTISEITDGDEPPAPTAKPVEPPKEDISREDPPDSDEKPKEPEINISKSDERIPTPPPDYYEAIKKKEEAAAPVPNGVTRSAHDQAVVRRQKKPTHEKHEKENKDPKDGHYRTLKRTRKFVVDGQEVVTTSEKIIAGKSDAQKTAYVHEHRKQDLRELKVLQKEENRQYQELMKKGMTEKENFDRKCETESADHQRIFDGKLDQLLKSHKQELERLEKQKDKESSNHQKKMTNEQSKEIKNFEKEMKQEKKLFEAEVSSLKPAAKAEKREQRQLEWEEKTRGFKERLADTMNNSKRRLNEAHRQNMALKEKQYLQQKQQHLREREAITWEMEEKHQTERYQMNKRFTKGFYYLRREQMLTRHNKERAQLRRNAQQEEDDMTRRHHADKKRLPAILKRETQTRHQMFKESLRISIFTSPEGEKEQVKQFEEKEKKRMRAEMLRQDIKHKKQIDELKARNSANERELESIQNEKRKILLDQETEKIKQIDSVYNQEKANWKSNLVPRKEALEDQFRKEREEMENFYPSKLTNGAEGDVVRRGSLSNASVRQNPDRASTAI